MKTALIGAFKLVTDDEYQVQYNVLSGTARTLYRTESEDLREWLYKQMENTDPRVANRSYKLYETVGESPQALDVGVC